MTLRKISVLGVAVALLAGCATEGQDPIIFGSVGPSPVNQTPPVTTPPTQVGQGGSGAVGSVSFGGGTVSAGGGAVGGQLVRVVPTDDRPVTRAATPPPAISGGTLATTRDGAFAVVADSDRDRIVIVDVAQRLVAKEIELNPGDEPGRVVAGPGQEMFVALRGSGEVVTVNPTGLLVRRAACLAPRGMAYDATADALHVACADGNLVTFTGQAEQPTRVLPLETDLRDVMLVNGRTLVSRLRSAELLEVGPEGSIIQRMRPDSLLGSVPVTGQLDPATGLMVPPPPTAVPGVTLEGVSGGVPSAPGTAMFEPAVAWRTMQGSDGTVHMLHQRDQEDEIHTSHDDMDVFNNPYGSGNPCSGIVREGISKLDDNDHLTAELAPSVPLAVDMAISPNGQYIAVAGAGVQDLNAPQPTFEVQGDPNVGVGIAAPGFAMGPGVGSGVQVLSLAAAQAIPGDPIAFDTATPVDPAKMDPSMTGAGGSASGPIGTSTGGASMMSPPTMGTVPQSADNCDGDVVGAFIPEPVVAVAFGPTDNATLFAQTRSPSQLYFVDLITGAAVPLQLGGASVEDSAHDLFHRSAGAGVACASCHPEGSDDGHVWNFQDVGQRRTQALDVGLAGTAPFHWDGELADVGALMDEVFVGRMGGVKESSARIAALQDWLFSIKPMPARRVATDAQAVRGQELFNSATVGCAACHSGNSFTNNLSYAVGTTPDGAKLQVPSLVGISYRSPLMHNGCAQTLMDRFNPACGGGDLHGKTSDLSPTDLAALVAYLETL